MRSVRTSYVVAASLAVALTAVAAGASAKYVVLSQVVTEGTLAHVDMPAASSASPAAASATRRTLAAAVAPAAVPADLAEGATVRAAIPNDTEHVVFGTREDLQAEVASLGEGSAVDVEGTGAAQILVDDATKTAYIVADGPLRANANSAGMLRDLSSLVSVDLAGLDTSGAEDLSFLFAGDVALESVDLARLDTSSATTLRGMFSMYDYAAGDFRWADELDEDGQRVLAEVGPRSLDLTTLETSKVIDMRELFCGCTRLKDLALVRRNAEGAVEAGLNTAAVEDMSYMFEACPSLESLDLTTFDTARVHAMADMFSGDKQLRTITVSSAFVTDAVIERTAPVFDECAALVGGWGTAWQADLIGVDVARVDGGTAEPGYLTDPAAGACRTFTLAYDLAGGEGEAPATQTAVAAASDESWTFAITDVVPEREGFRFACWEADGVVYAPGDEVQVAGELTLHAVWELIDDVAEA